MDLVTRPGSAGAITFPIRLTIARPVCSQGHPCIVCAQLAGTIARPSALRDSGQGHPCIVCAQLAGSITRPILLPELASGQGHPRIVRAQLAGSITITLPITCLTSGQGHPRIVRAQLAGTITITLPITCLVSGQGHPRIVRAQLLAGTITMPIPLPRSIAFACAISRKAQPAAQKHQGRDDRNTHCQSFLHLTFPPP